MPRKQSMIGAVRVKASTLDRVVWPPDDPLNEPDHRRRRSPRASASTDLWKYASFHPVPFVGAVFEFLLGIPWPCSECSV